MYKNRAKKFVGVFLIFTFLTTPMAPLYAQTPDNGSVGVAPIILDGPYLVTENPPEPQPETGFGPTGTQPGENQPPDALSTADPVAAQESPAESTLQDNANPADKKDKKDKKDDNNPEAKAFSASQSGSSNGSSAHGLQQKLPEIDKNTGALQYDYPISVPPGRNNVQPNLSLSYSSNSNENGIFGQGWSMSIPYIQRLNKIGSDKLYNQNSVQYFYSSLDGELVKTGESSYQAKTENGGFNKYTFSNNQWTVLLKDGSRYSFGLDESSRQNNPQNAANVYKWMLQEIRDTNDNYVSFNYVKDAGQIYPSSIKYTGNGITDGIFEVSFQRVSRPDVVISYNPGFQVSTNYYINEISAKVNGDWVTKYALNYISSQDSNRSIMNSVVVSGRDENGNVITLPATTFTYQASDKGWNGPNASWKIPAPPQGYWNFKSMPPQFPDLNMDGLPDLVAIAELPSYIWKSFVYLNNGNGWTLNSTWDIPAPPQGFWLERQNPYKFADLNGDGFPDMIGVAELPSYSWKPFVYLNNGSGWTLNRTWNIPAPPQGFWFEKTNPFQFADFNGDGLSDLIGAAEVNYDHKAFIYLNNGNGWVLNTIWNLPAPPQGTWNLKVLFPSFVELNGDGLPDMLGISDIWLPRGREFEDYAYINNGNGWTLANGSWKIPPAPVGTWGFHLGSVQQPQFADFNGDGLTDMVNMSEDPAGGSYIYRNFTYLNNGVNWVLANAWKIPEAPECCWINERSPNYHFVDLDGNGLLDVIGLADVWPNDNPRFKDFEYLNKAKKQSLISNITYPQGGNTDIAYKNAAQYLDDSGNPANKVPYPIFTVSQITHNDGLGGSYGFSYKYQGGVYYYLNSLVRQFGGYKFIIQTDSAGNVTKTYYNTGTGSNSSGGQFNDNYFKIGKPYKVEQYDGAGNLYSRTINKWDDFDLGNESHFVKLLQMVTSDYDGNATHRDVAESYAYDNANGNITQKAQYGEVTANNDGTFSDIGNDKFTTSYSYAQNSAQYVVGLPSQVIVTDQVASKVKESRFYYDAQVLGSVTVGNMTKKEDLKSGTSYVSNQKAYNSYGLATSETDPLGRVTSYTYDTNNLYPATVTNALNQQSQYAYDYSSGKVVQETNPNARVFQYVYDGLDRLITEKQPGIVNPASLVTKATYAYTDLPNATSVKKSSYLDGSNLDGSNSVDSYVYFDGLGRKIQERNEAENSFSVKDFAYNNVGLVQKESLPYFSAGSGKTSATTDSALYVNYTYDALGRVVSLANVVGTTVNAYDDWKVTTTDANGNSKDVYQNAYGNLVQVTEHNGSNTYNTFYSYDYLGGLTKITDALGNVRNFTYDALGRRLTAQDLHSSADTTFGAWTYTYDNAGNLTQTLDPKEQTIIYTYDELNRVLGEDYTGTEGVEVSYAYDAGTDGVGKLTNVTSDAVVKDYTYNALGLPKTETATIDFTGYSTAYEYDRLGNQTMFTNPDNSQVTYSYNLAGMLESIQRKESTDIDFINVVNNFDYSPEGKITSQTNANGVVLTNTYDSAKLYRLTRKYSVATGGLVIQDLNYTYDPAGNITRAQDTSATKTAKTADYVYDNLYRLTSAAVSNVAAGQTPYTQTFTYNAIGNMLTKGETIGSDPAVVTTYAYDGNTGTDYANPHAVTSISDGTNTVSYIYDNNGNLLGSTGGFTHAFDYKNRLISSTKDAITNTYAYDAGIQRVKLSNGTGTIYYPTKLYNVDSDTQNPAPITKHVFGGEQDIATIQGTGADAKVYYNATDLLNSSGVMTDNTGTIAETMDYFPFGAIRIDDQAEGEGGGPLALSEQRKYIGQEHDADTGLAYLNARYYNATLATFISQDPTARDNPERFLSDPQQFNSYSYARNNPITGSDPTGLSLQTKLEGAAIATLQVAATGVLVGAALAASGIVVPAVAVVGLGITGLALTGHGACLNQQAYSSGTINQDQYDYNNGALIVGGLTSALGLVKGVSSLTVEYAPVSTQGEVIRAGTFYRSASGTPKSLTPRSDIDTVGPKAGLSGWDSKSKVIGSKMVEIDISKLPKSLQAIKSSDGHISITPKTQGELNSWAKARNSDSVSEFTKAIQKDRIK